MRTIAACFLMFIMFLATAAGADEPAEQMALDVARAGLERAVRVGSEEIVPRADLTGARVDEVHFVHHPESLARVYGMAPVRKPNGHIVGLIGVDAEATKCLWYNFHFPLDDFPPVPASRASETVEARRHAMGEEGKTPEPLLIEGCDRHLYWRFDTPDGESMLIDAVRAGADVLDTRDGTADVALVSRAVKLAPGEPGPGLGAAVYDTESRPVLRAMPACYDIPGIPYHFQITSWYCGPSSLQMIMDYYGEEVGQHNIADVADDVPGGGCARSNMRRAAHFSGMSTAIQDSSLIGYIERKLGYACIDAMILSNPRQKLKNTIWAQHPMFVLTWFSGAHTAGHYRVVKGYDDSLDVFIMHDPWYAGALCGPDLIVDQAFFVDDLWDYSDHWGMVASPWMLTPTVDNSVSAGDTFTVDLRVLYPGPTRFSGAYTCTDCEATISLPAGLSLASGSLTISLADMSSGDSADVSWEVVADGPAGDWTMAFTSQGVLNGTSSSYISYSDSIGGHACETVTVGSTLLAGWDEEERLTSDDGSSETCIPSGRAMVMEDDGTVHIVWADTRDDTSEIYYRRRSGGAWEPEARLTQYPSYSFGPCIALAPDGGLHVAWVDWRDGNQEIYYKSWDESGGWTADERVTSYNEIDRNPALAVVDTAVCLVWESRQGGAFRTAAVQFSYRTAAGWSTPLDVDASPARDSYRPSLAVGEDGLVHLVYERQTANTPDENERIVHQSWNGLAWSGRTGISSDVSFSRNAVIAAGPDSTLHVVWHDGENINTDIFYAMYDGSAWQPVEEIVTNGYEASTPSVAADGAGDVHVVWSDHRNGETEIYSMTKGGSGWGDETRITRAVGASVLPSVAADIAGDIAILWTDFRHDQADLYYIESEAGSGVPGDTPVAAGARLVYLARPYPMPFRSVARLSFSLADHAHVSLDVFDVTGRLVRTLARGEYGAGDHSVAWDGTDGRGGPAAPGVYFVRCATTAESHVRRLVFVK
ncbi:MAG: C39 family peptidase [bacterium]